MNTVLVTGGCGYIGSCLVEFLLTRGYDVRVLDTFFTSKRRTSSFIKKVAFQNASVSNADAVARSLRGVSTIFHLAGRSDVSAGVPRHLLRLAKTNVEGTATILAMAHSLGVNNIVFTSTAEVYGDLIGGRETDYVEPVSAVGATKLSAEALGQYYNSIGMEVKILRLFSVWGRMGSTSFVNKLAGSDPVTLHGDGSHTRDYLYIDDAVNALYNATKWDPGIYNIGTGDEVTTEGLFRMLRPDEPTYCNDIAENIYRSCADMSSTLFRTGWKARTLLSSLTPEEVIEKCLKS